MALTTYTATQRRAHTGISVGKGEAAGVKCLVSTLELATSTAGTYIDFGRVPSNARILGASKVYFDDLATTGSPTLDLGFAHVNSNITTDDDALNDGIALSSASTGTAVIKDIINYGLPAWDFVNGQTSDPGGELKVQGVTQDAATTDAGTVTLELYYVLD